MIVITPYLVKPVSDSEIKLPTDGFNAPNDFQRALLGKTAARKEDTARPAPSVKSESKGPDLGSVSEAAPPLPQKAPSEKAKAIAAPASGSAPGFSFE